MARTFDDTGGGSLDLYLREIADHPILEREDEVRLALAIREGDEQALNRLVAANLRFVVTVAKRYRNHGVAFADLVNEGNLGLMRAARRFDETKGVRFISYAVWWIRQAMMQAIAEQSRIVRVPVGRMDEANRVVRVSRRLSQELGRRATPEEMGLELGLSPDAVQRALEMKSGYVSLDAPVPEAEDTSMLELIPDREGEEPDERTQREALRDVLESSLTHLPDREARILKLYFGLDGEEAHTLEQIGQKFAVSRERIRQIKDRALVRLRLGSTGRVLESFRDR
ncbi:MAG: RNA polymerase sigma factor RpoD/SigA [Candidatus Palauibacterales bacterium]|nr:RNA polymerase sigma factor RpoD/SigA [Candidatus Palauibacterales bacterium]MDP2482278.1 RNA polymerase sigma factor RpoD/SigA [Candidatus Palauibacterales bacterium]